MAAFSARAQEILDEKDDNVSYYFPFPDQARDESVLLH